MMVNSKKIDLQQLSYLNDKPEVHGLYKQQLSDFCVQEDLGYELTNAGEHVYVYIEKRDSNTLFVAKQLAKFANISPKLVSYAGLKDRNGVVQQWFGLHLPGKQTPDFSQFECDNCQVLKVTRHNKKLKIGALKGNHFSIILREIDELNQLETRLNLVKLNGVPNYFGEQRFGRDNNNIKQALQWAEGEITVKDRSKRSFYLSAARSAIFNDIVSQRVARGLNLTVLNGDVLQLVERGSWFVAPSDEIETLQQRLTQGELNITAPLVGDNELGTKQEAQIFENDCLVDWQIFLSLFQKERLATVRRSILLRPKNLRWQIIDNKTVNIEFSLPAGCFATSVLRELIL